MKRLSGTDAVFLSMETPFWHQHVGGVTVFDGKVTFDQFLEVLEQRLAYAPKFRWKLKNVPFGLDRPVWVDDEHFDVRRHVGRVGVPAPGGPKELGEVAGWLMSTQLDRRHPLWEVWWIDGLAGGKAALFMKYHHCLYDGVAGANLASAILDTEPHPPQGAALMAPPSPEDLTAGPEPSDLELLLRSAGSIAQRSWRTARYAVAMAAKGAAIAAKMGSDEHARAVLHSPRTPFNATIGPRRLLSFSSVSLDDVKRLKKTHGVKVNDVIVAICGGAMRSYLINHDALPDAPLVTGVPMSTRAEGDTTMDNQISTMFVSMATDLADPVERLHAVSRSTRSAKEMAQSVGSWPKPSLGEVASPRVLSSVFRAVYDGELMSRSPLRINTLVSNVAGPPFDLYFCGAQVTGIFPCSVILEGMGTNLTVISYGDRLDIGLHVDPDLVPDPWQITDGVPVALAELLAASGLGEPTPVKDAFYVPDVMEEAA